MRNMLYVVTVSVLMSVSLYLAGVLAVG